MSVLSLLSVVLGTKDDTIKVMMIRVKKLVQFSQIKQEPTRSAKILKEISKSNSPTKHYETSKRLALHIPHKNFSKLKQNRDDAFKAGVLVTEDDDFVNAKMEVGNSMTKIKMRLKGDVLDHLKSDRGWSFQWVRGGESISI